MKELINLYTKWKGQEPRSMEKIAGGGSNREYYRIYDNDGKTVIGVVGTSLEEDHAFLYLSKQFNRRHLPVPKILASSSDELRYLQSDLGHTSLFDALAGGRNAGGRYNLKGKSSSSKQSANCRKYRYLEQGDSTSTNATRSRNSTPTTCSSTSTISNTAS